MSYVENNLLNGERIIYEARLHWIVFARPVGMLLVSLYLAYEAIQPDAGSLINASCLVLFVWGLCALIAAAVSKWTSEFAVTDRRVLIKVGFIRRKSLELLLSKVEGIGVDQSLVGRLFAFGTISVTGTGGSKESFRQIDDPLEFRRHVQQQLADREDVSLDRRPEPMTIDIGPIRGENRRIG